MESSNIRAIAFYLPQYHPIPENDKWWGKGFTEWTNVTKAKPLFPGHYQPRLPADLGFYDLRVPEVREAQAEQARSYGLYGFCYYHYWFNGRRILERPFKEVLESGQPDFPFCLCWANENWTRAWDGRNPHILLEQQYSYKDDTVHIRSLLPAFADHRYIKIQGKPLFLVYRTGLLPNPQRTADIWREIAIKEGIGDIYLARVESFGDTTSPNEIGFDASVEFAPDWEHSGRWLFQSPLYQILSSLRLFPSVLTRSIVLDYDSIAKHMLRKTDPEYIRFRCVMPSWDNSPRRKHGGTITLGSTPDKYATWLAEIVKYTQRRFSQDEQIVFINAWNEWAEGNYLEPDQKWGRKYLEATARALSEPENINNAIRNAPPYWATKEFIHYHLDRHLLWRFRRS